MLPTRAPPISKVRFVLAMFAHLLLTLALTTYGGNLCTEYGLPVWVPLAGIAVWVITSRYWLTPVVLWFAS